MRFRLGVGILSLIAGLIAAGFALSNAYEADSAEPGTVTCGHEVMDDADQRCVETRPGQAPPPPGYPAGGRSYEEMKDAEERTAVSKAWIFGVEVLGLLGVFLSVCGLVFVAGAIRPPDGPNLPALLGVVVALSAAYALALWPAQDDARAVSPVSPGILGFLGFSYFPLVVVAAAAAFTLMADRWMSELFPPEPE
ncbi:hypothetical protein E1281_35425 [Actinomadura sp. KC345]|uniref:hypothetical protein n=1 Tax=Actinomadura sp. KC345 TaxID=2530371 RepID=UPI0010532611|nr:hypothetical protein [Actinomadura sp. KC345]TDC43136.1 hypothetical protein E1281_35425 [Actinomadura sp. KC345]